MARERYAAQVALLVQALPFVARERAFALKGGTAINLFHRAMPRLSVDIDLTYLPLDPRAAALVAIDEAFDRIAGSIAASLRGVQAKRIAGGGQGDTRILLRRSGVEVKIEVSPVARGAVFEPDLRRVTEPVEDAFGFAEMPVLAFEDLFAGKLHAALDRQHPRDLYDVTLLYDEEGLTDPLFRTLLVYLACSRRPLHELVDPHRLPIDLAFAQEFDGMTVDAVPLERLLDTRERMISDIQARLYGAPADFLRSLHAAEPDFALIGLPRGADLPAVQWKLLNLAQLKDRDPAKHEEQARRLDDALARGRAR